MGDNYYEKYPGDYLRDTRHLTVTQHGAYNLLMDIYYAKSIPLPADTVLLARMVGCQSKLEREAVASVAEEFFPVAGDGLRHNSRCDREIEKRAAFIADQSRKGRLSAEAKRQQRFNSGSTAVQPKHQPELNPPSPSPSPSPLTTKKPSSKGRPSDAAFELSGYFFSMVKLRLPNAKNPNVEAWSREFDLMIRIDGREPGKVRALIAWMQDDFWGTVVLSPKKLREKWDQIEAKMKSKAAAEPKQEPPDTRPKCSRCHADPATETGGLCRVCAKAVIRAKPQVTEDAGEVARQIANSLRIVDEAHGDHEQAEEVA